MRGSKHVKRATWESVERRRGVATYAYTIRTVVSVPHHSHRSGQNVRTDTAILCAVLFVIGGVVGWVMRGDTSSVVTNTTVKVDTLNHVIERVPTVIVNAPAQVDTVRVHDTLYSTPAFVAKLDTVVLRDTVQVQYAFPQHTFSVAIRSNPDTVRVPQLTVTNYERRAWWIDALTHIGAGAIGYAIGGAK